MAHVNSRAADGLAVRVPATPRELAAVRHAVRAFLTERGVATRGVEDVVLIVSELTTNAIHASATEADPVEVRLAVGADGVLVEVEDRGGRSFERPTAELPEVTATRGRGLLIVEHLAGAVEVVHAAGRTCVRVRYR